MSRAISAMMPYYGCLGDWIDGTPGRCFLGRFTVRRSKFVIADSITCLDACSMCFIEAAAAAITSLPRCPPHNPLKA